MARPDPRTTAPRRAWPALAVGAALVLGGCTATVSTAGPTATSSSASPSGTGSSSSPSTSEPSTTDPSSPASPSDPATSAPPATPTASSTSPASPTTGPTSPSPSTTPAPPTPTTTPSAPSTSAPTAPDPSPTAPGLLRRDDTGPQVQAVQERLAALGYWLGQADGTYGHLTQQAVLALQGAAGLDRDGVVGPATREALDAGTLPSVVTGQGHAVEIDRDAGLVVIVDDGRPTTVLHTSTGTFERYTYEGQRYLADTPAGTFDVYRAVDGWDGGPLGDLYRPRYFQRDGIAVHGFPDVPAYPASHGCARVSLAAMDMVWADDLMAIGTPVVVR